MDITTIWIITILLLALAILHFFLKADELPTLVVLFFIFTGLMRYDTVVAGKANWVVVNYAMDIFNLNDTKALLALNYFLLGTGVFIIFYIFFSYTLPTRKQKADYPKLFDNFIFKYRKKIVWGFYFFLVVNFFTKNAISGSLALGNSYFYLFGLAAGGFILLLYNYFRLIPTSMLGYKIYTGILIYVGITLSYNPTVRFQFLSWMIALGIFFFRKYTPWQKLKYYAAGGFVLLILFAMAGVARTVYLPNLSWDQRIQLALERNDERSDQNMLDGFMMVLDVYPEHLDYRYGMEHIEILLRPIPRQLWPDKPLGGYANKLGLNDVEQGTVGISQTIYGSFYEEGGIIGIILFSIFYAWLLVKLLRYTGRFNSDMRWLLKGIILASMLPLLRGGDLPGIYAFIGMSFWPVFILLYYYNKEIRRSR